MNMCSPTTRARAGSWTKKTSELKTLPKFIRQKFGTGEIIPMPATSNADNARNVAQNETAPAAATAVV
jgi:hypothetical protein